jgi:LysR family transcriptional activator of mexEF-oprN operon
MNDKNFAGFDLNLLVVFAALMRERSATRAGESLALSQSAVSHSLRRLREAFADKLFVRVGNLLVPTPRAEQLLNQLLPALDSIERTMAIRSEFVPRTSNKVFKLGVPGAVDVCLTAPLMKRLAREAVYVDLIIRQADITSGEALIAADRIDVAVSVFFDVGSGIRKQELTSSNYSCIFDGKRLGVKSPISLADYLKAKHVLTSFSGDRHGVVDTALQEIGHSRRVAIATQEFSSVPFYLFASNLIATLPTYAAKVYAKRLGLTFSPLPFAMPDFTLSMIWPSRLEDDAAHRWFRGVLTDCASASLQ